MTVLPFIARHFIDYDEAINLTIQNFDAIEILKIFFFSIIAAYVAKFLKIPAPFFLGPVISTSIIYINGISIYQFPDLGLNICLIIIGANIGLRFQNYKVKDFISNFALGLVFPTPNLATPPKIKSSWHSSHNI